MGLISRLSLGVLAVLVARRDRQVRARGRAVHQDPADVIDRRRRM